MQAVLAMKRPLRDDAAVKEYMLKPQHRADLLAGACSDAGSEPAASTPHSSSQQVSTTQETTNTEQDVVEVDRPSQGSAGQGTTGISGQGMTGITGQGMTGLSGQGMTGSAGRASTEQGKARQINTGQNNMEQGSVGRGSSTQRIPGQGPCMPSSTQQPPSGPNTGQGSSRPALSTAQGSQNLTTDGGQCHNCSAASAVPRALAAHGATWSVLAGADAIQPLLTDPSFVCLHYKLGPGAELQACVPEGNADCGGVLNRQAFSRYGCIYGSICTTTPKLYAFCL